MEERRQEGDGNRPVVTVVDRRRFLHGTTGIGMLAATGIGSVASIASRNTSSAGPRWQRESPSPGPHHITVGDECVFASRSKGEGTDGESVIAVDIDTGDEAWRVDLGGRPLGSLTLANDTLFVKTEFGPGERGVLRALDATTGDELWRVGPDTIGVEIARIGVVGGVVCVETPLYKTAMMLALDADTGEERWRIESEAHYSFHDFSYHYHTTLPSAGGNVFVRETGGGVDGSLLALDLTTGEKVWTFTPETGYVHLVHNGTVYHGSGGTMHALDATTGEEEWTFETGDAEATPLTAAEGTLFVEGMFYEQTPTDGMVDRGRIYAVDPQTGEEQWQYAEILPSLVTVSDGTVLAMENDSVYGIDASTGEEEWSTTGENGFDYVTKYPGVLNYNTIAPLVDDTLFLMSVHRSESGFTVDALDRGSGKTERFFTTDSPFTELKARDGTLLVGTESHLYALDVDGGSNEDGGDSGSGGSGDESSDDGSDDESGGSGDESSDDGSDDESGGSGDDSKGGDTGGESGGSRSGSGGSAGDAPDTGSDDDATGGSDTDPEDNSSGAADDGSTDPSSDAGNGPDDPAANGDETPGMGIPAAVTSLGGVGYVLRRRLERLGSDDS